MQRVSLPLSLVPDSSVPRPKTRRSHWVRDVRAVRVRWSCHLPRQGGSGSLLSPRVPRRVGEDEDLFLERCIRRRRRGVDSRATCTPRGRCFLPSRDCERFPRQHLICTPGCSATNRSVRWTLPRPAVVGNQSGGNNQQGDERTRVRRGRSVMALYVPKSLCRFVLDYLTLPLGPIVRGLGDKRLA